MAKKKKKPIAFVLDCSLALAWCFPDEKAPYPDSVLDSLAEATAFVPSLWHLEVANALFAGERHQRSTLAHARGAVTIIQDADLEYDPADFPRLIERILRGDGEVVYGSRYLDRIRALPMTRFRLAVDLLNWEVRLLYGQRLTDEATCYKAFRTSLLRELDLQATGFEICPEVTAKVCRLGRRILEVAISYVPRGHDDGKKIGWRDGVQAAWTLLKWRFLPLRSRATVAAQ